MEEIIKYLGNFHPVILHLPIGAFLFTLFGFAALYSLTKFQLIKEQKRFDAKFKNLDLAKVEVAKNQIIYKEILSYSSESKI